MLSTSTTTSVIETTVNSKTTWSYLVDNSSTVHPDDDTDLSPKNQPISFIIAPLCAVGIICFITAMILLFLRKKRLDRLRHHLMPFYNFDPEEEGEDWEAELLDDGSDFNNRRGYKSIERPQIQQTQLSLD